MVVQDYCRAKLGKLDRAIQPRSFQEVKSHNAAGQCWLTLDGKHPRLAFTLYHRWALPCRDPPICSPLLSPISPVWHLSVWEGHCRSVVRLISVLIEESSDSKVTWD